MIFWVHPPGCQDEELQFPFFSVANPNLKRHIPTVTGWEVDPNDGGR